MPGTLLHVGATVQCSLADSTIELGSLDKAASGFVARYLSPSRFFRPLSRSNSVAGLAGSESASKPSVRSSFLPGAHARL